jgi:hypothetical protein
MSEGETRVAKPKKQDAGLSEAPPAELPAAGAEPGDRWVIYRGGHPVIRRAGVVLFDGVPLCLTRAQAAGLAASPDVDIIDQPTT